MVETNRSNRNRSEITRRVGGWDALQRNAVWIDTQPSQE